MWNTVGAETVLLTLTRFSLFSSCRKYLLRTLYSNLNSLSTGTLLAVELPSRVPSRTHSPSRSVNHPDDHNFIEIETLPPPATHTPTSGRSFGDAAYLYTAISGTLFSWCFAESCMLFLLLILQGLGVFSSRTRLVNWRFSLFFLVFAILVAIPVAFSFLLSLSTTTQRLRNPFSFRAILAFLTIGCYLLALSYIPLPASLEKDHDIFTAYLSRLIVLGTIILGLLSGFGAINSSWQFFPTRKHSVIPSERDIETAQYALNSVRNDIKQRLAEAARRNNTVDDGSGSWFSRVRTSIQGGADASLLQELQGLEALEYQMGRNLETLRDRHKAAQFSRTWKGKVVNVFGRLFMVYCFVRIVSSAYSVIFLPAGRRTSSNSSSSYPDLLTDLLLFLITHLSSPSDQQTRQPQPRRIQYERLAAITRQISLVLVGLIILSSIRLVLKGVTRALRVTSRTLSTSLIILVLAQIMGIYLLSTLVQMRSSFPPPKLRSDAKIEENLFTTIPAYEMFGSMFDWSFLIAAGVSGVVKWSAERMIT